VANYVWLTKTAAQDALLARLNAGAFWSAAEAWIYISEALRLWNGLVEAWNTDWAVTNQTGSWVNTGTISSPRTRTVTDQYLYGQMCSMLLEPQLNAGLWAGTNQFTLQNLQYSLQKRVQEVIQATSCNIAQLSPINATPGTRRNILADTVLEPRRIRFLSVVVNTTGTASSGASQVTVGAGVGIAQRQVISGAGIQAGTFVTSVAGNAVNLSLPTTADLSSTPLQFAQPVTLLREDTRAFEYFENYSLQDTGLPHLWTIASEPPLAFDTDLGPSTAGTYDVLALTAAGTFAPPTPSLLGIPDDWSWLPMYGALADVLGMEAESTDRQRSAYCLQRYTQGLEIMKKSNWLLKATVNGTATSITSLAEMDQLASEWQASLSNLPTVVMAGMDFIAPTPGIGQGLTLTMVGNAPLLDSTGTYVQVAMDDWQAVLDYAQHVATFKLAGKEFSDTMPLLNDFYRAAVARNKRWITYGIFTDQLHSTGQKQQEAESREETERTE
jgi:hypothetical protein